MFGTTAVDTVDAAAGTDGWLAVMLPNADNPFQVGTLDWFAPDASHVWSRTPAINFRTAQ